MRICSGVSHIYFKGQFWGGEEGSWYLKTIETDFPICVHIFLP